MEINLDYSPKFYFLSKSGIKNNIKNADYSLNQKYLNKVFNHLNSKDIEIGLHGSYRTHDNLDSFLNDKKLLENKINKSTDSNRFHWLQFNMSETPDLLEKLTSLLIPVLVFKNTLGLEIAVALLFIYTITRQTSHPM
mgnify:CR=1 FL=1|jgi:hypothetical protein|tara:strand:+ start:692 stop:1105 length:414 start_codon:yes stop_codon:yes gene_type:complete